MWCFVVLCVFGGVCDVWCLACGVGGYDGVCGVKYVNRKIEPQCVVNEKKN